MGNFAIALCDHCWQFFTGVALCFAVLANALEDWQAVQEDPRVHPHA